ncbi:trypsin-like peptidase domain-containing protein [Actinoplanes sp. NPDC048796]|uniref:trypsin-like peptidase domain-containing protein n=1 Tax=Actinoplanes sp. NPDC048796 TaxID=3155640 RepID=UPI0034061B74
MTGRPLAPPPAVWLADAVRAARRLSADPATTRRILELLGLIGAPPAGPSPVGTAGEAPAAGSAPVVARRRSAPAAPPTAREVARSVSTPPEEPAGRPLVEREPGSTGARDHPPRRLPTLADVLDDPRLRGDGLADLVREATVAIVSEQVAGSGFFIAPGVVLTCAHVVGRSARPRVRWREHLLDPFRVELSPARPDAGGRFALPDVAVLWVAMPAGTSVPRLPIATEPPAPGEALLAVGVNPAGPLLGGAVAAEVSGPLVRLQDAQLPPGTSGGPILGLESHAVVAMVKETEWATLISPALAMAGMTKLPDDTPAARLEPGSLLPPGRQRAILSALCGGPVATDAIDLDELVDRMARREPIRALPMTVTVTTRRGLQVLVDYGDGMRPFVNDQDEVVQRLERIAGPDGFEVLRFATTPLDPPGAGPGPVWTWRQYRPPLTGQPVIVLSDLGACAPAGRRAEVQNRWRLFAGRLRESGHQVVALAPLPTRRYPPALRAVLPILTWDRGTSVADAIRTARTGAGRVAGRGR